ncbi:MAG: MBL fold metallo-hydrolase [Anaerolineales bacterium]|nr:MBL fold metallo-hydrolase [Anaerolineales bacterium]
MGRKKRPLISHPPVHTRMTSRSSPVTIVNVGYRSTNYWVISNGRSRLLVDIGWPGTLGTMKANLKKMDIPLREIRYALATHYHIDHAGLGEELKREGVPLLVVDIQETAVSVMKQWTKPHDNYVEITPHGNVVITLAQSRQLLRDIGIAGEILPTPGHSDHCVSLLLDDGSVFTGDLPPEQFAFDNPVALASWQQLRERGAARVYPAHGPIRTM